MIKTVTRVTDLEEMLFKEMKYKHDRNNLYHWFYLIDKASNFTDQDLREVISLRKSFSLYSMFSYRKDFVLSPTFGFENRLDKMFKHYPTYATCSNFEKYKDKIPDILNRYDNLIITFRDTPINNKFALDIYDMVYANYKQASESFKQKLIMFPINRILYYFANKIIAEGNILWRNIGGRIYRDVDGLLFSGS